MITSKKIVPGLYEVSANGRVFQIEDLYQARGDGTGQRNEWMLYEMVTENEIEAREWCNDFVSKREAMAAIEGILRGEE